MKKIVFGVFLLLCVTSLTTTTAEAAGLANPSFDGDTAFSGKLPSWEIRKGETILSTDTLTKSIGYNYNAVSTSIINGVPTSVGWMAFYTHATNGVRSFASIGTYGYSPDKIIDRSLSQTFELTTPSKITFDMNQYVRNLTSVKGATAEIYVLVDGVKVFQKSLTQNSILTNQYPQPATVANGEKWTTVTLPETISAGKHTIRFGVSKTHWVVGAQFFVDNIRVENATPEPEIYMLSSDTAELLPVNNKMHTVHLATDNAKVTCAIKSITMNEEVSVLGKSDTDSAIVGNTIAELRATRNNNEGRVYTLETSCTDGYYTNSHKVTVSVPHDMRDKHEADALEAVEATATPEVATEVAAIEASATGVAANSSTAVVLTTFTKLPAAEPAAEVVLEATGVAKGNNK